jgi:hypothetical protein
MNIAQVTEPLDSEFKSQYHNINNSNIYNNYFLSLITDTQEMEVGSHLEASPSKKLVRPQS